MKKGFTLMELLVVIIIIGILAGLGIPQYFKAVERGRTAEAKAVIGQIRSALEAYYAKNGTYVGAVLGNLDIEADITAGTCSSAYYYKYSLSGLAASAFLITATRCTALEAGKPPNSTTAYFITLNQAGAWAGTAGYF